MARCVRHSNQPYLTILFVLFLATLLLCVPLLFAQPDDPKTPAKPARQASSPTPAAQPSSTPGAARATPSAAQVAANVPAQSVIGVLPEQITFVQISDAHLFDGGKKRDTREQASAEQQDTWAAFRWAIRQTNALMEGGAQIDFVVFTGDFGLDFVRDQAEVACYKSKPDPDFANEKSKGGLQFYTPAKAAQAVADELRLLKVNTVYLLPGNNDLANEDPCDLDRYRGFVKKTMAAIPNGRPKLVDLTRGPNKEGRFESDTEGPFRLLGLNSASFKKPANYSTCGYDDNGLPLSLKDLPGCPRYEIDKLSRLVDKSSNPFLIFTHIPDVIDPLLLKKNPQDCAPAKDYSKRTKDEKLCGSWAVTDDVHKAWEDLVLDAGVVGVFAGHLHDSNRSNYATTVNNTSLYNGIKVAEKTWIAPPLALKYQADKDPSSTARGLLLVRVQKSISSPGGAVSVIPFWYLEEKRAYGAMISVLAWILSISALLVLVFMVFRGAAGRERARKLATALTSPPVLTLIGLAIIIVVFWKLLAFITEELSVPRYFYLVLIFGAFGGLIGAIRSGNEFVWSTFEKSSPFRLGLLGDILIGMGGATAVALMFDNPLHIKDGDSSETLLLISISFIAGVVGRNLVQAASEKLLRRIADEAAQKAVEKTKVDQSVTSGSQTPPPQHVSPQAPTLLVPASPISPGPTSGAQDPKSSGPQDSAQVQPEESTGSYDKSERKPPNKLNL